jgi:hypothetical protein
VHSGRGAINIDFVMSSRAELPPRDVVTGVGSVEITKVNRNDSSTMGSMNE